MSLLLSLLTYGLLILGIQYAWAHRKTEARKYPPTSVPERLVYLVDEPDMAIKQDRDQARPSVGNGAIDPRLMDSIRTEPRDTPLLNLDVLPTALPKVQLPASLSPGLPVAVGGDGQAKGPGNASGQEQGKGSGSGNGHLSGVKGDGPTLSVADMEVVHQEIPKYPGPAQSAQVQGMVVLRVTIDEKGVPTNIAVVSGHALLLPETLRAMKLWRFASVKFHGQPVSAVFTVSFLFLLNNT